MIRNSSIRLSLVSLSLLASIGIHAGQGEGQSSPAPLAASVQDNYIRGVQALCADATRAAECSMLVDIGPDGLESCRQDALKWCAQRHEGTEQRNLCFRSVLFVRMMQLQMANRAAAQVASDLQA